MSQARASLTGENTGQDDEDRNQAGYKDTKSSSVSVHDAGEQPECIP